MQIDDIIKLSTLFKNQQVIIKINRIAWLGEKIQKLSKMLIPEYEKAIKEIDNTLTYKQLLNLSPENLEKFLDKQDEIHKKAGLNIKKHRDFLSGLNFIYAQKIHEVFYIIGKIFDMKTELLEFEDKEDFVKHLIEYYKSE